MDANSNQAWTIAWRTPRANRFHRATNWTGTWHQAVNMARAFNARYPEQQVYYVSSAAYDADTAARVASGELPARYAEDNGNILMETGRRVRMVDDREIDADLVARTYCEKCYSGKLGDSTTGMTDCPDCDGTGVVPATPEIGVFEVGDRVLYGVRPGRDHTYTVTKVHPVAMVQITRHDARLGRDVVIDVYRDELDHAPAESTDAAPEQLDPVAARMAREFCEALIEKYPTDAAKIEATFADQARTIAAARRVAMNGITTYASATLGRRVTVPEN